MKLADQAIRAGYRINSFSSLASTSDTALRRAAQGDRGKLWIVAAEQTGGRGRQGRSWSSPPGNLYASLLLIDPVTPALAPQLGFVAGVALATAINDLLPSDATVSIKWPNDLVHRGAKLAGILVEGVRCADGRFACVLGFGINRQSHPSGLAYETTDLFSVSAARPTVDALMIALSASIDDVLRTWDRGRNFQAVRQAWLGFALPRGTRVSVATQIQQTLGAFETIDAKGRLVLQTNDGMTTIDAGDVFLMNQPEQFAG